VVGVEEYYNTNVDVAVVEEVEFGDEEENNVDVAVPVAPRIYPWARSNLRPLSETPDPSKETFIFWHIPKSGGSTVKTIYRCLGKSIDIVSQPGQIMQAKELGLVASGQVDIIFSSYPAAAVHHLFDTDHKGRMLAMFRDPVDRLISKFFYLQIATWENTYRPEWKDMEILEWIQGVNIDNDHMVKKLAGKIQRDKATREDLELAKRTVRNRFIVGLMTEMEESVHRYNAVMGIDEEEDNNGRKCMQSYFGKGVRKQNSNSHAKVEKDSPAYQLLVEKNQLDIELYEYVLQIFDQQEDLIKLYQTDNGLEEVIADNGVDEVMALENEVAFENEIVENSPALAEAPENEIVEDSPPLAEN